VACIGGGIGCGVGWTGEHGGGWSGAVVVTVAGKVVVPSSFAPVGYERQTMKRKRACERAGMETKTQIERNKNKGGGATHCDVVIVRVVGRKPAERLLEGKGIRRRDVVRVP